MFANCLKFYGRVLNMFLSNNMRLGRPFKVMNTWAQLQLICMIVTVLNYATNKELHKAGEKEEAIQSAETVGSFFVAILFMRFFHPALSLLLRRSNKASSNCLAVVGVIILISVSTCSQTIVLVLINLVSVEQRKQIFWTTISVLNFELWVWDFLL